MPENIKPYHKKLENNKYSLRLGEEVPDGDVNLAYIHTPQLDVDENVAIVHTSSVPENIIPYEQRESMAFPDENGKLSYADLYPGLDSVQEKPPFDLFPSKKVNITRQFKSNNHTTEDALYYKFEIYYHYDSKEGVPERVVKYNGDQIELVDENGSPIGNNVKHDIYVMAMKENPNIYWVRIYMKRTTDEEDTFKIRYNHIDEVTNDNLIQTTKKELELYRNASNQITVSGETKRLMQGGKLRIINGQGAYEEIDEADFSKATPNDEVFIAREKPTKDGYEIYVTQKSESDPRIRRMFNYKVVAKFHDPTGREREASIGYINDWVMHPTQLLNHEKYEYTQEWKHIGIPYLNQKLNAKDMIQISQPIGTPSIPEEAIYEIYDAQGNLMYTTKNASDHPGVEVIIQEKNHEFAAAKALPPIDDAWESAKHPNVHLKSLPIEHEVSVIAERQKTQWDYEFKVTGEGQIGTPTVYTANWWACANVGIYKSFTSSPLDVLNRNRWNIVGSMTNMEDWHVKTGSNGRNYIELLTNHVEVAGFYQRTGPEGQNMSNATDYEFSTRVKMTDMGDDDIIGLMFRVQGEKEYYMFGWERDHILSDSYYYSEEDYPEGATEKPVMNGIGRIQYGEGGCSSFAYTREGPIPADDPRKDYIYEDWDEFAAHGFGENKKRIYKATPRPSHIPGYYGHSMNGLGGDSTGCSFDDITDKGALFNQEVGKVGWKLDHEYKITVVVSGNNYRIYINDNASSSSRGTLVCEATDSTYQKGSVGIFCTSQRWTQWSDLVYNEIEATQLCTNKHPITLNDASQVRVSPMRVSELLKDQIESYANEKYGDANYEVLSYQAYGDQTDLLLTIDEAGTGYVWASTTNEDAGGIQIEPWYTSDNNLDVHGSGHVHYHEDGHFTITISPEVLPTDKIPEYVDEFRWNNPMITKGENVSIRLASDNQTIIVEASIPPITSLNRWITITPEDPIHKNDGIVSLMDLQGEGNILDQLNIPDDIPIHEILLRIERGRATGPYTAVNQEHRVNYRFRQDQEGLIRYPVDQFADELGVNRLRLSNMYHEYLPVNFRIDWTVVVPVDEVTNMHELFARGAQDAVMIEPTVGKAEWKIRDNMLVDDSNTSAFVGAYNKAQLNMKDASTDFSFKTVSADDDLMGVLFRVQDRNNFYMYAIEADRMNSTEANGRISDIQPDDLYDWKMDYVRDSASYQDFANNKGWKTFHQRVYKVKNGKKSVVAERSTIINDGHIQDWQNNIRVESTGTTTNLYFQTGLITEADWERAYQIETEWDKGAIGVLNYSQPIEFLSVRTSRLETVTGTIPNLNYTGRPRAIMSNNTKRFADEYVKDKLNSLGYNNTSRYTPISYEGIVEGESGEVSVSRTGEGPIQVYSHIDRSVVNSEVDLIAWTHYEDLEAAPVFAVKIDEEKKIEMEKPKVEQSDVEIDNWYVRVKNGKFHKRIELPYYEPEERTPSIYEVYPALKNLAPKNQGDIEEVTLEYEIPEYTNSEFYNEKIVLIERESPIILNEYAIQTRYNHLALSSDKEISYIEVEAFRNQKTRILRVKDVDAIKGIIYLMDRIREQDEVIVRYAYYEEWYTYHGFHKSEGQDGTDYYHLDFNPSPGHTHTVNQKSLMQWIPTNNEDVTSNVKDVSSNELLVKPIHVYLRPIVIRNSNGSVVSGTRKNNSIYHTDKDYWFNEKDFKYDPSMFRLGKVFIQANSSSEKDITILDTRTRGGGLDEALTRKIISEINKESLDHWDIGFFDGQAYQENGVIIIRLPETILESEENPSGFTKDQVQEAVQKHKAYGVLPIIEYYDPDKLQKNESYQGTDREEIEKFEI